MKKIGKLNGKVVVAGDKNLVTANQIHYEEKDGNITLSERRGGELNSVTSSGGSGEGSELLYYKVVYNDFFEQYISSLFETTIGFLDIIKFKSSEFSGCDIGINAYISGSGVFDGEITLGYIGELFEQKKILGFTIYKGSRGVVDYYGNTVVTTIPGNIKYKIIGMVLKNQEPIPPEYQEHFKTVSEMLDSCFILISKEEYEALS